MIKNRIEKIAGFGGIFRAIGRGTKAVATVGPRWVKAGGARLRATGNPIGKKIGNHLHRHPYLYGYGVPAAALATTAYGDKKIHDANTPWYQPTLDKFSEYGTKAMDWIKENPGTAGLIGLGLVGVPLLSSFLDDDDDDDDRPRRRRRYIEI